MKIYEICYLPFLNCHRSKTNFQSKVGMFQKRYKKGRNAYPTLKYERYFDGFSRCLYITAKSHEDEEVLDPEYTPTNS